MATRTSTATSGSAVFAIGAVFLLLMTVGYGLVLCNDHFNSHADIKHGDDANVARSWIWEKADRKYCRWDCEDDGRTRYICAMDDGRWAILVMEGGMEITAYIAGQDQANVAKEGCTNPWHMAHP